MLVVAATAFLKMLAPWLVALFGGGGNLQKVGPQ